MSTIETISRGAAGETPRTSTFNRFLFAAFLVIDWLEAVAARRRSRLALLELTDDQLKDIGISRSQADNAARAFPYY